MKKTNPIKRIASSLAVASAFAMVAFPAPAFAYEGDPWFRQWETTTFAQFQLKVEGQFYAINEYMNAIRLYLTSGVGDTGTGLIATIQKTQDANRLYSQESDALQQSRNQVLAMNQAMANRVAAGIPDPRDCDELPRMVGARAGGGGGSSAIAKGRSEARLAAGSAGALPTATAHAAIVYANHEAGGYCAAEDINYSGVSGKAATRNAFNCTTVGAMPDGDARAQGLFVPAHDYASAPAAERMSLTFDNGTAPASGPSQAAAADDTAGNIVARFAPPALNKGAEQTPDGRVFLAKTKVFNARLSPAINALTSISSRRNAAANPLSADALALWNDGNVQGVYDRIFSGAKHPQKPSEIEVLRYEVMRRYADYGANSWAQKVTNESDPAKRSLAQLQSQAVEMNLLYQIHGRLEENNAIQAAILSQLMNPITKTELELNAQKTRN